MFVLLVLGRFSAVLGEFLAVLGRFSAYLQRVLGGFSFRLALGLIFGGSGGPEAARMVRRDEDQGIRNSRLRHLARRPWWGG